MAGLIPFNRGKNELSPRNLFGLMDDFFSDAWPMGRSLVGDTFKVDVKESDSAYIVEAEMPGITKEEISLSLRDEQLTIGVARSDEANKDQDNYIHRERRCASMQRSIYLAGACEEGVEAKLESGVLQISVPKRTGPGASRQIEIK